MAVLRSRFRCHCTVTNQAVFVPTAQHTLYGADYLGYQIADLCSFYINISASLELAASEAAETSLKKPLCLLHVLFSLWLCRYLRSTAVAFLSLFHKAVSTGGRCYDAAFLGDVS